MSSSKINYMSSKTNYEQVPSSNASGTAAAYDFRVADSAVRVIVDDNDNNNAGPYREEEEEQDPRILLGSIRAPVTLNCCPHCSNKMIRTKTRTYPNGVTWFCVVVGAIVFIPLCWIPLVVDPLKKTDHYCQKCGAKIGSVQPLEGCCVKEQV